MWAVDCGAESYNSSPSFLTTTHAYLSSDSNTDCLQKNSTNPHAKWPNTKSASSVHQFESLELIGYWVPFDAFAYRRVVRKFSCERHWEREYGETSIVL